MSNETADKAGADKAGGTMNRKFSASQMFRAGPLVQTPNYFLIEAPDREQAEQVLSDELASVRSMIDWKYTVEWSTHETPTWRAAWRRGEVKVMKAAKIPEGIE